MHKLLSVLLASIFVLGISASAFAAEATSAADGASKEQPTAAGKHKAMHKTHKADKLEKSKTVPAAK